ncbi:hypothetical protein ASC87_14145 [Rhizobacter sp. Root1221]|nr:hypothetical protein ASC87_14145 [Rhizobacter sp. Root1221]
MRSIFPFAFSGSAASTTTTAGTMYSGSTWASAAFSAGTSTSPATYPTKRPSSATTTASFTPGCASSCASISPSSIRSPRTFTWWSSRPRYSSWPSSRQRTRSPVRYSRSPASCGSATNRSAVSPALCRYPRPSPAPPRCNSPATPSGTRRRFGSSTTVRTPAIGRPIATAVPASHVQCVTSIAASVGPYRLFSTTCGSRSNTRACTASGNASPLHTMRLSPVHACTPSCAMNACSIDGTKCSVVTACAWISSASRAGSRWSPGPATASRAPTCSGQKNSHTDTSNPNGVFCSTVSPTPSGYAACIHASRFASAPCRLPAPLGRPVEPDV